MEAVSKQEVYIIEPINKQTFRQRISSYKKSPISFFLLMFVLLSAFLTFGILLYIVGYMLVKGIPYISVNLFSFQYTTENVFLMPALINTIIMTFFL